MVMDFVKGRGNGSDIGLGVFMDGGRVISVIPDKWAAGLEKVGFGDDKWAAGLVKVGFVEGLISSKGIVEVGSIIGPRSTKSDGGEKMRWSSGTKEELNVGTGVAGSACQCTFVCHCG